MNNYNIGDFVKIDTKVNEQMFPSYIAQILDIYYVKYDDDMIKWTVLKNINNNKIKSICNDEIIFPIDKLNVQLSLF